ncbi:MAG: Cu(I)-responsive transcriptional regulator [Polaromonas sp.]|nr:Cu(I)-responsive transcriptional regulator [Polaromonas sp.]
MSSQTDASKSMTATAIASAPVNIGSAAEQSGVSAKMIRYYESLDLLGKVRRTDSGYRQYNQAEVHVLRFIKRARDLGFSMAEIAELVSLWNNRRRTSASVKRIAQKHADELAQRVAALQEMQRTLSHLIHGCHGDSRPECPILDGLAGD